jgi:hypothetical protein
MAEGRVLVVSTAGASPTRCTEAAKTVSWLPEKAARRVGESASAGGCGSSVSRGSLYWNRAAAAGAVLGVRPISMRSVRPSASCGTGASGGMPAISCCGMAAPGTIEISV